MSNIFTAALVRLGAFLKSGPQAAPRSSCAGDLNYRSVNVLDPSRLARAFMLADQGWITDQAALFEMIEEQDAHVFGELGKRRRAVTGLGWRLEPPRDATESELARTAELEEMLRGIPRIEDAFYDVTDAIGKGFAALELNWAPGKVWLPAPSAGDGRDAIQWEPQRHFRIGQNGEPLYVKDGLPEQLIPGRWLIHEHRAKSGYIEGAALFRVLGWTYAYKAYDIRDMQRFLEVYGLPLRLGKYPAGLGDKERDTLLRAVRNIGNDGAGVVPETMSIEFVQAQKAGTVDDFLSAIEYWERKQSIAILGGTLTSQSDGKTSTNALGAIHDKVRREIMLHDVRQIEPTLTAQLVTPVAVVNGLFPADRVPAFAYLTEETVDQKKMVEVLEKAVDIGLHIGLDWAHEAMQIPKAKDDEPVLRRSGNRFDDPGKTPDEPDDLDADSADLRRKVAALAKVPEGSSLTAAYAAQMAALCAPFEQAIIDRIAAIVAEAGDFDTALEGIAALKRDEGNYAEWAKTIAQGTTAAHLAGIDAAMNRGK
jgi:phage gp29-like protein